MTSPKLSVELESGRFLTGQRISVSPQAKNKTYAKLKSNLATGKNKKGVPLSPNKGCHALANTTSPQSQGKKGSLEMSMATCIDTNAHSVRTLTLWSGILGAVDTVDLFTMVLPSLLSALSPLHASHFYVLYWMFLVPSRHLETIF
jgi:hypothetical protein